MYSIEKEVQMTVSYSVDKDLYHAAVTKHDISLITTEYHYGNELLVHLLIGKNLGIRLNDRLSDLLPGGVQNEQFFLKKTYNPGDAKPTTRSTFDAKLKRFDSSQTTVSREILEDYAYIDKAGLPGRVKIVMLDSFDVTTATIEFEDAEQYERFTCPGWLAIIDRPKT
jgi:hypothetical protein